MRGTAIIKELRNAITNHIDKGTRLSAIKGTVAGFALVLTSLIMIDPAAAQSVCQTGAGGMLGESVNASQVIAGGILAISLVAGAILKWLPFKFTDRLANFAIAGFFIGLVVLVAGYSAIGMVNGYIPWDLTNTCGAGGGSSPSGAGAAESVSFLLMIGTTKISQIRE